MTRLLASCCAALVLGTLAACQQTAPYGARPVSSPGAALQPPSLYTTTPGPNGTQVPDVSVQAR
ncbi:MAG: hypothetical protein JOY70_00245 [Acidisphaera sp.]|nr:hypothetical protein [Acidisphaera sp.]MBV9813925.1 hypothetical protein [Acetobacteraceae bacterium]